MSDQKVIGARSEYRETIIEEGRLRGHTQSEALNEIIKLGLPRYIKKFRPKYAYVDKRETEETATV